MSTGSEHVAVEGRSNAVTALQNLSQGRDSTAARVSILESGGVEAVSNVLKGLCSQTPNPTPSTLHPSHYTLQHPTCYPAASRCCNPEYSVPIYTASSKTRKGIPGPKCAEMRLLALALGV
eukprot:2355113-Rhodomonas_salina.1